jgi:hypothetical protein
VGGVVDNKLACFTYNKPELSSFILGEFRYITL